MLVRRDAGGHVGLGNTRGGMYVRQLTGARTLENHVYIAEGYATFPGGLPADLNL